MKPLPKKRGKRPEAIIQGKIKDALRLRGWFVKSTHGNAYQSGFPDLFVCHSRYGQRWIEVKLPDMKGSKFTSAQVENFPKFSANGSPIWILTGDSDYEIDKLFGPENWYQYLKW